jgi:hypothetical protein
MRHHLLLPLLLCAPIGCQQINWDAASGIGPGPINKGFGGSGGEPAGTGGTVGNNDGGTAGGGAGGGTVVDASTPPSRDPRCDMVTAGAYRIVRDNCAFCHQDAGLNGGPLNFILDLPRLMNVVSGVYDKSYLVPGNPDESLIYFRVNANQMPPADRVPRPSRDVDLPVLNDFIANCLTAGPPYTGWPRVEDIRDGGVEVLGPPGADGGPCKAANTCDNGGCCVFGLCRGAGKACGMSATGQLVPGICMNGSCGEPNARCGSLTQICCPPSGKCTAPRAACGPRTLRCEACGALGEACCDFGSFCADAHLSCIGGGGGGNPGSCQPCGTAGLPCCGEGVTSAKKCDVGACVRVPGVGPGTGDICPGGNSPDAGRDAGRGN